MERPLALGFFWGCFTGQWELGLSVAIFFELFWIDQIPTGTYIPPNASISTLIALSLVTYFHLTTPGAIAIPLLLSIPMALVGKQLEYYQRRWQDAAYNGLLHWARKSHQPRSAQGTNHPGRLIRRSLFQLLVLNFVLFSLGLVALIGLYYLLLDLVPNTSLTLPLTWGHLWLLAAMGGLMSLRLKRSYTILASCVLGLALVGMMRYLL